MTTGSTNSITAHTDWYATISVTTTAGTSVTVDGITKIAEYGSVTFTVYKSGDYEIIGELDGHTNTVTQYVSEASYYYVTLYMSATIRVNAPVNTVVTIGSESQTVTGTYVDFTVYETGTYTVTGVLNGITTTNTVYVSTMGNTYSTTLVFGCYINIHSNNGTDVIYNGLRQTVGDTGYVRYWITGTGTYKFLCIYKGQSKEKAVVVTSTATDIDESIYFVPSAYQELEYLKSDGYSWIETGIATDISKNCKMKARTMIFNSDRCVVIGSYTNGSTSSIAIEYGGTSSGYPRKARAWLGTNGPIFGTLFVNRQSTINTINDCEFNWAPATKTLSISMTENGVKYSKSQVGTDTYSQIGASTLMLFSDHRSDKSAISTPLAIYSCEVYVNDVLSANFIPCKRVSDNELGMYDIVTDTFYTNAGTGSFIAGPMANLPAEYQEVEYISIPNTAYINTEYYPTNNTELTIVAKQNASSYTSGDLGQIGCCRWTGNPFWTFGFYPRSINGTTATTTVFYGTFYSSGGVTGYINLMSSINKDDIFEYDLGLTNVKITNLNTGSVSSNTITRAQTFTSTQPFWLGAFNNQGSILSINYGTYIYSCILKENGVTVRHLIPCYRKSDNVAGVYDIINGVFYDNAGTGTITSGSVIANASLPSEYTYVKYIASTSAKTQYLNLGETGTNTTGMVIKVYDDGTGTSTYIGGQAVSNSKLSIGSNSSSKVVYGFNTDNTSSISANVLRTLSNNYLNNRAECYDNIKEFDINQTLIQSTPINAFCSSYLGTASYFANMRAYYIVLTSGTGISNIFIPCYRNSDNVIGMYDIVKGNFKTNAGSGTFVDGGYLPSTYQQVEYLKSDGYSWINTDVSSDVTASWNIKTRIMNFDNNRKVIVGSYLSDDESCLAIEFGGTSNSHARQIRHFIYSGPNSGGSHYEWISQACTLNTILDTKLIWNFTTKQLYTSFTENNYTYSTTNNYSSYTFIQTGTSNFLLFSDSRASRAAISYPLAIYSCTIEKNGNIVRNFIPCYRKSDNVAGMFDLENMVFYENSGTGTFTVGPDVN